MTCITHKYLLLFILYLYINVGWLYMYIKNKIALLSFSLLQSVEQLGLFYGLDFDLHAVLHAALSLAMSIFLYFMFLLAASLNLSLGLPLFLFPFFNWEYSSCFWSRLVSILCTWPTISGFCQWKCQLASWQNVLFLQLWFCYTTLHSLCPSVVSSWKHLVFLLVLFIIHTSAL